jgi:hypothetical protein
MGLDMAQGSVKHLQEAAAIIGMRQVHLAHDKIVMELVDLKQRFSKRASQPVFLEVDLGKMSITNDVWVKDEEAEGDTSDYVEPVIMKEDGLLTPDQIQKQKQKRNNRR